MPNVEQALIERIWTEIVNSGIDDWSIRVAAGVLALVLAPLVAWIGSKLLVQLRDFIAARRRLRRALRAIDRSGRGVWLPASIPISRPAGYNRLRSSIPILTIANLKGGVGKTTIAANLFAQHAINLQSDHKRVLAIDFDYQGSLTSMLLTEADNDELYRDQAETGLCRSSFLISQGDARWLRDTAKPTTGHRMEKGKVVPSFYALASTETRLMIEWLLAKRQDDIRYALSDILLSDDIQNSFSMIVIDAPPRLTTACIQALASSTHVIIPTVLDALSARAVGTFADQLRINSELWPQLRIAGVLPNMTEANLAPDGIYLPERLTTVEGDAMLAARDALASALETAPRPLRDASLFPETVFVPDKAELSRAAGERIAYASASNNAQVTEIRNVFDRLSEELQQRFTATT